MLKQKVNNGWGSVGDEIVCVVKRARPISGQQSASVTKVRQGDVRRAVIVRTRKAVRRPDGRVVRFDSLSKVLSSGMRIGFISAPQPIIDAVVLHVRPCQDSVHTQKS